MLKYKIMLSLKISPKIAGQKWLQKERFGQCFGSAFKPFFRFNSWFSVFFWHCFEFWYTLGFHWAKECWSFLTVLVSDNYEILNVFQINEFVLSIWFCVTLHPLVTHRPPPPQKMFRFSEKIYNKKKRIKSVVRQYFISWVLLSRLNLFLELILLTNLK